MHAHRWVELEGPSNFRDLGGLPTRDGGRVRTGLLYRSDSLALLSASDVEHLRSGIGLRRVVDLRSAPEIDRHGRADLAAVGVEAHFVVALDAPAFLLLFRHAQQEME